MKPLSRIVSRIVFVVAEFAPEGTYCMEMWVWRQGVLTEAAQGHTENSLAALVVCGHGVVSKSDDAPISIRVRSDAGTFVWSSAKGITSFVRRERVGVVDAELQAKQIVPVAVFCTGSVETFRIEADRFAEQLHAGLRWRTLFRFTSESSAVAQAVVRHIALPLLGLYLILLAANAISLPKLNSRHQVLRAEVATRERAVSDAATSGVRQRELMAEFAVQPAVARAVLCDRIGSAVPVGVVLTTLEIEPLVKRFESRKPLLRKDNLAVVCGTAPVANDVSAFVRRLSEARGVHGVRLASVEKERDGDKLLFRIELTL